VTRLNALAARRTNACATPCSLSESARRITPQSIVIVGGAARTNGAASRGRRRSGRSISTTSRPRRRTGRTTTAARPPASARSTSKTATWPPSRHRSPHSPSSSSPPSGARRETAPADCITRRARAWTPKRRDCYAKDLSGGLNVSAPDDPGGWAVDDQPSGFTRAAWGHASRPRPGCRKGAGSVPPCWPPWLLQRQVRGALGLY
jgi:hypothetical protein